MKKIPILGTLIAALVASLCCLGPALLVALGVGSVGITAWLAKSHRLFYILGLAILGAMIFLLRKQKTEEACCPTEAASAKSILKPLSLIVFLGVLFFGLRYGLTHNAASWLYKQASTAPPAASSNAQTHTLVVSISGMTCIACSRGIEAHLKQTQGIVDAQVSFDKKKALVCYNPQRLSPEIIEKHISETGYSGKTVSETVCAKPGLSGNSL